MRRIVLCLTAACLLAGGFSPVPPAAASERYPDRSPWLIGLELGWAMFAMDDINAVVREFNSEYGEDVLGEIKDGIDFGVHVGRRVSPAITLGVKYTRLDGSTDFPDPTGAFEINTGANVWGVYVHYVPPLDGGMAYGVGADLGWMSTTGEINLAIPGSLEETGDFRGSAPAVAGYLILDFAGTRTVSIQAQIGYRHAKITDVTLTDNVTGAVTPADGAIDHSGFFLRAAFRLHP